jgi:hypothetical protein
LPYEEKKNATVSFDLFLSASLQAKNSLFLSRMNTIATILEVIKYTIPALIVLVACYLIVQKFLVAQMQRKQLALFRESQDITLRLRLQAYERMVLFIERLNPRQLLPRIYDSSLTVRDMQQAIIYTVRAEFEHNLSQQIYVSKNVWETVKNVKEQELNMVNHVAKQLDPDAPAKELHKKILDYVLTVEALPTDVALQIINDEVKKVLSFAPIS